MTHTVILDEDERDRRMVNHINEILRHCRIGHVTEKVRPILPFTPALDYLPKGQDLTGMLKPVMSMPKCGCRVGSACGNVACPHGAVVTCGDLSRPPVVPSHGVMM